MKKWEKIAVVSAFAFILVCLFIFAVLIVLRDAENEKQEEGTTYESSILLDDWRT